MTVDTLVHGGTVATATDTFEAAVAIDDGTIVGVGDPSVLPDARRFIDASGKMVIPGLVDPHVHIDYVPPDHPATYETETRAAAMGGVTTLIDFAWQGDDVADPTGEPGGTLIDGIEAKRAFAGGNSYVDHSVHAVIIYEDPAVLDELPEAIERGVTSFKMYRSEYPVAISNGFINRVFRELAELGGVSVVHTEDPTVVEQMTAVLRAEGRSAPTDYPASRPDYSEAMAAEDAVRMATEVGAKYYGFHTTCRKAADELARFRVDGSTVRAETCVQYTTLDESVYETQGTLAKIAPPIRTPDDVDALFEHLSRGSLDVVSTDHNVFAREAKEADEWWDASFGANHLQHVLPLFHDAAVVERGFSYPFLVRVMCTNPAATFGLHRKGTLDPGTDADLVVLDPDATYTITAADNESVVDYTIYEGREVTGRVEHTLVRGEPVVADGRIVGEAGHGRFVEREIPDWSV